MTAIHDEVPRGERQAMIDEIEELRALTKKQREALELCRQCLTNIASYPFAIACHEGLYESCKAVEECLQ